MNTASSLCQAPFHDVPGLPPLAPGTSEVHLDGKQLILRVIPEIPPESPLSLYRPMDGFLRLSRDQCQGATTVRTGIVTQHVNRLPAKGLRIGAPGVDLAITNKIRGIGQYPPDERIGGERNRQ